MKLSNRTTLLISVVGILSCGQTAPAPDPLPSWNEGANKARIVEFVRSVSDPGSSSFVPESDRIATFDNDGTLWAEQPMYFQTLFSADRVRQLAPSHPEWKTTPPFQTLLENGDEVLTQWSTPDLFTLLGAAQDGVTTEYFKGFARGWLGTAKHPRFDRPYVELVYQPMIELMDYLRENGFQVYICSGGGIDFIRSFAWDIYGIPQEQVIGTTTKLDFEASGDRAVVVKGADFTRFNDGAGKPVGISLHIGKRPILAAGNSDGDLEMLEYTDSGDRQRLLVLVHHDDAEREYAYDRDSKVGRLDKALEAAEQRDWTVVSMKNDFRRIFAFEE